MKKVDFDANGEINYSEFVSGTLDRSLLSKDNLLKVFKYLDSQGEDELSYDSLKRAFQRRGDFHESEFQKMMLEINITPPVAANTVTRPLNTTLNFHYVLIKEPISAHHKMKCGSVCLFIFILFIVVYILF